MGSGAVSEAGGQEGAGEGETRPTPGVLGFKKLGDATRLFPRRRAGAFLCSELTPLPLAHKEYVLKK